MNQPTIVVAKLDDAKLKASIDQMVNDLNIGLNKMTENTDAAVTKMQKSLQSVGNIKFGSGGSDGDSSKQVRENNKVTKSVDNMTAAYDSFLSVLQKSGRTESGFIKNFNAQDLATLKFALRDLEAEYTKINREGGGLATEKRSAELREQIAQVGKFAETYENAFNAMSKVERSQSTSAAAQKFAKEWTDNIDKVDSRLIQLRKYFSDLEKMSTREIRVAFANALKMPAGNIDEIADKLMALQIIMQHLHGTEILSPSQIANGNKQINELVNLLETQLSLQKSINSQSEREPAFIDAIKQYREGLRAAAAEAKAAISGNPMFGQYLYSDSSNITGKSYTGIIYAENDARAKGLTIEEQILQVVKQKHEAEKMHLSTQQQVTSQIQQQVQTQQQGINASVKKTFAEYEDFRSAIAAVLQLERDEVTLADSQNASYKALSLTLKQLTAAYENLGAESRKSENAGALLASLHEVQRAMQEIRSEMSRPISLQSALGLPETTLDDITYKIKMLRAYAQGVNTETSNGQSEITKVSDTIDALSEKVKNLQKTTKQTVSDANSKAFETIAKKQEDTIGQVGAKIKELKSHLNDLQKQPVLDDKAIKRAEDALEKLYKKSQKLNDINPTRTNVNKALKMSEKSLDEIAQKIQRLSSIRMYLNVGSQKAEIEDINKALERLRQEQSKILGQNKNMLASNNALARSFNYMKNRLAFYLTVGASTQFIKNLIEVRSQYEMNERALGILLDSASRGTRIFKELSEMSLVSPYTLIELSNAAKQLTAYDIAAKDVVDTTRRLADMASAVGVPVERLTYALGQIKAYGYLNSRDARMFANAGIPLVRELANYYSELRNKMVSTADVYDMMKKKAIDYNDVMNVVNKMTDEGGKFFDFQAKMADTLKVRLANLTLAWNNMLNDIGKDSQGLLTSSIKGLANLFKHWREFSRILQTVIVAFGVYKAAQTLTLTMGAKQTKTLAKSFIGFVSSIDSGATAMAAFRSVLMSIPFTAVATALATLISYFWLFNNSSDKMKEELDNIRNAFDGVRQEIVKSFADAIKTDNIGTQLNKLRDILELAESELHVTIPINLEDVDEKNIKAKLKEAKAFIDEYLNFSQTFAEAAAGSELNTVFNEFGQKARSVYTSVTESVNTVIVALQDLKDAGKATDDEIRILNELLSGQSEDESRIEYLQRLVSLYEKLGLIGKVSETSAYGMSGTYSNISKLQNQQMQALENLGIKNKEVFSNMLNDVQGYYKYSTFAGYEFEQQVMRVAQKIDIRNIPEEQRTVKLSAAINEEASQNNWNQFEKEFARQVANEKFGTNITISDDSKKSAETELQEWQKKQQKWMDDHGLKITLSFQTNDTEVSYAKRMLQEAKDAAEEYQTQLRKLQRGTGSQDAVDKALKSRNEARQKYFAAGGDMSQLDKKENAARKKAAKEAESELQKALKNELQLIEKVRSNYKELTKAGVTHAEAISSAISGYDKSVTNINAVLKKYGVGLDLSKFAGNNNPHALLAMLQKQLDTLKGKAKPSEIQALEVEIQKVKLDVDKFDTTQITDALNRELGNIKDEYELALELDANPELGDMFANIFGIDTDALPQTFAEAFDKANKVAMQKLQELKVSIDSFDLMSTVIKPDENGQWMGLAYNSDAVQKLVAAQKEWRDMYKKNLESTEKMLDDYVKKYGDYSDKMAAIEANRLAQIKELNNVYYTEEMRRSQDYVTKLNAINAGAEHDKGQVKWDEFKNSSLYVTMFENLEYASTKTLEAIHQKLEELKGDWKQLTPEQLKTITDKYLQIETQLSKRNPFKGLIKNAKEYAKAVGSTGKQAQERFRTAQKQYDEEKEVVAALKKQKETLESANQTKTEQYKIVIDSLALEETELETRKKELAAAQKLVEKYDLMRKIFKSQTSSVAAMLNKVSANLQGLGEFRDTLNSLFGVDGSKGETVLGHNLDGVIDGLSKAGQAMSSIVSSATSGNVFGVLSGTVNLFAGIGDSISSIFGGGAAKTRKLNREINNSIENVRKLSLAYKDLERAVETEMGSAELQARRQEMVNKEAQLRELQRQKQLESEKRSKDRDDDRIKELESSIKDLQIELAEMADEIAATLLGSKVKDAAEEFVSTWVDAWRAGEDTMAAIDSKFDDMIDNMIMKSVASRVVANRLQKIWDTVDEITSDNSEGGVSVTMNELQRIKDLIGDKSISEAINDDLKALYGALGIAYGSNAEKSLSALQQGISGITEDQAGALEAYWNINTQQQFVHTDLLTQIRDIIVGFDLDIHLDVMSQMLLQLQNSYILMQSMAAMMDNWTVPAGNGIRVELLS